MATGSNFKASASQFALNGPPPSTILIIGGGVFGLSTALALTRRARYANCQITILDRSPIPAPDGSSVDSSRIIRADYSDAAYAELADEAQHHWRHSHWGADGRYTESGFVLTADAGRETYARNSFENVCSIEQQQKRTTSEKSIRELTTTSDISSAIASGGDATGTWGYLNPHSGWAHAEACIRHAQSLLIASKRITFITAQVEQLFFADAPGPRVAGAVLADGQRLEAELTVLAAGAWTPTLIDLRGRVTATGQTMAYVPLTPDEQARWAHIPVTMNMSSGLFIIPPVDNMLKVARHTYGYRNPQSIGHPEGPASGNTAKIKISIPRTTHTHPNQQIPAEAATTLRSFLARLFPTLAARPFAHSRVCWYADTRTADFLITYHPRYAGLFVATGGSGHGFKFLPVLGERVVDAVEARLDEELAQRWRWRDDAELAPLTMSPSEYSLLSDDGWATEDGSRGGERGLLLAQDMQLGKSKL
ncbi:MAG: hypothetical protein M1825_002271 [Sarcosagium campestre]|nr:MAG: hypothetical protein M1825_002271 [Sarcosagium campestre]